MTSPPPAPSSSAPSFLGIEFGTWPAWASVLVATIAALVALASYRRGQREKREAQARLVWVTLGTVVHSDHDTKSLTVRDNPRDLVFVEEDVTVTRWAHDELIFRGRPGCRIPIYLRNEGKELVLRWRYDLLDAHDGGLRFASSAHNSLPPESTVAISHIAQSDAIFYKEHLNVAVTFQDGSGHVWRRSQLGPIQRVPLWRTRSQDDWYGSDRARVRLMRWLMGRASHKSGTKTSD